MSLINTNQFQYQTPFQMSKAGYTINKPGLDFFFKKTQLPWIGDFDSSPYITDEDMRKLENAMVQDTFAHRHRGFWLDNSAQSFGYLTVSVLLGEGIECSIEGKDEARSIIEDFFSKSQIRLSIFIYRKILQRTSQVMKLKGINKYTFSIHINKYI